MVFRGYILSSQVEAGVPRRVDCEMSAVAFDAEARLLAGAMLGTAMRISGFLDRRSRRGKQVVLHATRIEFESEQQS